MTALRDFSRQAAHTLAGLHDKREARVDGVGGALGLLGCHGDNVDVLESGKICRLRLAGVCQWCALPARDVRRSGIPPRRFNLSQPYKWLRRARLRIAASPLVCSQHSGIQRPVFFS